MRTHTRAAVCWLALTASTSLALAQSQLEWLAAHDGPQSQADYGRLCAVDSGGNVYVAGRSYNPSVGFPPPPPQADFELVKYSPAGAELWTARYDAFGSEDFALDCQVAPSGDVYVCGYGWNGNNIDVVLLKYTSAGAFVWARTHDGPGAGSDMGRALAFDASGNVLVGGHETWPGPDQDAMVLAYSPAGTLLWNWHQGGSAIGNDAVYALATAPNGEIWAAGMLFNVSSNTDAVLFNVSGNWSITTTNTTSDNETATELAFGPNGLIAIGGWRVAGGSDDFLVAVFTQPSMQSWERYYAGPGAGSDRVRDLAFGAGETLWVTGASPGSGTGIDVATLRYDLGGTLLTTQRWNGAANLDDSPYRLLTGSAGQAWVCGFTTRSSTPFDTDALILQYDDGGALNWAGTYSSAGTFDDRVQDMELAPGHRIAMAGYTTGGPGGYDYLALQVDLSQSPQGYCTAKVNSLGCSARMSFTGMPSASAASGFVVRCSNVRNEKSGLLFYSTVAAASAPFQGGYLCAQPPTRRSPLASSGGSPAPANDCSGVFALDLNAYATGALGGTPAPELSIPGTNVYCQQWSRDPGASFNTNLSSALSYVVLP